MAYVKPVLVCQDMPVTFQQANVAQQNLVEEWLQLTLRHGWIEPAPPLALGPYGVSGVSAPPPLTRYGRHNDKRIPRAAVRFDGATAGLFSAPNAVGTPQDVLGQPRVVATGVLDVPVLGLSDFYAETTPFGVALSGPLRLVVPSTITATQGLPTLRFELYQQDSGGVGAFLPADFAFVAFVYGSP